MDLRFDVVDRSFDWDFLKSCCLIISLSAIEARPIVLILASFFINITFLNGVEHDLAKPI